MFLKNKEELLENSSIEAKLILKMIYEKLYPNEDSSAIYVKRNSKPINEFIDNDIFYYDTFPDLFLFRMGINVKETLPRISSKPVYLHFFTSPNFYFFCF